MRKEQEIANLYSKLKAVLNPDIETDYEKGFFNALHWVLFEKQNTGYGGINKI